MSRPITVSLAVEPYLFTMCKVRICGILLYCSGDLAVMDGLFWKVHSYVE